MKPVDRFLPGSPEGELAGAPTTVTPRSDPPLLRVLIIEDSEDDALLLKIELQRLGYQLDCERVDTREGMNAALARQTWDLVVADYVMPQFSGLDALALVKANGLDLPFIIVSGHITDSTAVAAMKAGAHDYVMKENLARLGPAVLRELRDAEGRGARRAADQKLHAEQVFRQAIENSVPAGISVVDLEGRQTYVNPAFCEMVGWPQEVLIGARPPFVYWPPEDAEAIAGELERLAQSHKPSGGLELRFSRRTGERISVLVLVTPLIDASGQVTGWVSSTSDITALKQAEARLAAEHAITRHLANAPNLELAAPGILLPLLHSLEVEIGALWILDHEDESLRLAAINTRNASPELRRLVQDYQHLRFKRGQGLSGRAWETGQAVWVSPLSLEAWLTRRTPASSPGLQTGMAFPIINDGQFFGVLEFFTLRNVALDDVLRNMMTAIGSEIGQLTQRRLAEVQLQKAHDELEIRVQRRTSELNSANAKLQASISDRRRLENELLEITEKERRRLALDLHDDLGQKLSGIAFMTKGLELKLSKAKADTAREAGRIHELVQEAISHTSDLAQDLATLDLEKKTLTEALEQLTGHAGGLFAIACDYQPRGNIPPLDRHRIRQLYKITQEALTNAIKHGQAASVTVSLFPEGQNLVLTIENDGLAFPDLEGCSTGMGLRIMSYRASLIGASLDVRANGSHGTRVTCTLPLEDQN